MTFVNHVSRLELSGWIGGYAEVIQGPFSSTKGNRHTVNTACIQSHTLTLKVRE